MNEELQFKYIANAFNSIDKRLKSLTNNMVTKVDLKSMATKEDIKNMATKEDIKNMATKEDIKNMATKEDIKNMATKEDIKNMATKNDIKNIQRNIRKINISIEAILEDIKMLDDRTRPVIRIK